MFYSLLFVAERSTTSPSPSASHQTAVSNPVTTALAQLTYYHNNPYNLENPRSKQVTQAILDYFISDMRPLSTIENEAFLGLFIAVDPMYAMFTLPEVTQLERLLHEKYRVQKAVVGHTFQSSECVAIAVEDVGLNRDSHIILSASFITHEWQRFSKILEAFDTRECTSTQVEKMIVQTIKEWGLIEKKIGIVRDAEYKTETSSTCTLSTVEQYTCFERTLSTAASSVYMLPEVVAVIAKVRQCIGQCQNDSEVKAAMDTVNEHRDGPKSQSLIRDNAENRMSTLRMFQQLKQYK